MKTLMLSVAAVPFLLMGSAQAKPPAVPACVVVVNPNRPFVVATQQRDREYRTYEQATEKAVTFLLKAGHGVVRLEALVAGEVLAMTFYSHGRAPVQTDRLSLTVRAPDGTYVEAACTGVDVALAAAQQP